MKRILRRCGSSCEQSRNVVKLPCIDPTVGMQPRGATSTSRKAFRKRDACVLSSGMPNMLGYCDATPACKAAHSASTPARSGGSPGTPISRWRNSTPVSRSIVRAMSPDWRIVACAMSAMSIRSSAERRQDLSNGIFMALSVFGPLRSRRGTPRDSTTCPPLRAKMARMPDSSFAASIPSSGAAAPSSAMLAERGAMAALATASASRTTACGSFSSSRRRVSPSG